MALKTGPLNLQELLAFWKTIVDEGYSAPLVQAGDGHGLEVFNQAFAQYARVSKAIDVTTQACYILPWSGQTNDPASGPINAIFAVQLTRTKLLDQPLIIKAGTFLDEIAPDFSPTGTAPFNTGRRYFLVKDVVFVPSWPGPITAQAKAEAPGYGYNNPQPNTITHLEQLGSGFTSDKASVTGNIYPAIQPAQDQTVGNDIALIGKNGLDPLIAEHAGQYVLFTQGANAGLTALMAGFLPSPGDGITGTGQKLQWNQAFVSSTVSFLITWQRGEPITFSHGLTLDAYGIFLGLEDVGGEAHVVFQLLSGSISLSTSAKSQYTAQSITVTRVLTQPVYALETKTAMWRVLDWVNDWGLQVTNPDFPFEGKSATLDAIGDERGLRRSPGESDTTYRKRVAVPADVVTPNAIKRTLNRVLGTIPWCLREVGTTKLHGIFFDGDPSDHSAAQDAYDFDTLTWDATYNVLLPNFQFEEPVVVLDSSNHESAAGYFARETQISPTERITIIRTSGVGTLSAGSTVHGLRSGATRVLVAPVVYPTDWPTLKRFNIWLDYLTFRAYFEVGVPTLNFGEFGFSYDVGSTGAYDGAPALDFYDGFPTLAHITYANVFQAIDEIRAAGVGFDLYLEDVGCVP